MHAKFTMLLQLVLLLFTGPLQAEPVYRWVDSAGITHFSQTAPPDPSIETSVMELDPPLPDSSAADDYYSVINQAARMESRRLELERLRAEAEALRAQAAAANRAPEPEPQAAPAYPYPVYGFPAYPGHWRPPHHRPPHHRPPHDSWPPPQYRGQGTSPRELLNIRSLTRNASGYVRQ
jgi:hypothetical protein